MNRFIVIVPFLVACAAAGPAAVVGDVAEQECEKAAGPEWAPLCKASDEVLDVLLVATSKGAKAAPAKTKTEKVLAIKAAAGK